MLPCSICPEGSQVEVEDEDVSGGGGHRMPPPSARPGDAHQVIIPRKRVSGLHVLDALTHHLFGDPSVHLTRKHSVVFSLFLLV